MRWPFRRRAPAERLPFLPELLHAEFPSRVDMGIDLTETAVCIEYDVGTDPAAAAEQPVKSITVHKQVLRADGTREPVMLAAYMDRDPDAMEAVIREHGVRGLCSSGTHVLNILNGVPAGDAERITRINERQRRVLDLERSGDA